MVHSNTPLIRTSPLLGQMFFTYYSCWLGETFPILLWIISLCRIMTEHLWYVRSSAREPDFWICEWCRVVPRDDNVRSLCFMSALHCLVRCKCLIIAIIQLFINYIDLLHNPAILQLLKDLQYLGDCYYFVNVTCYQIRHPVGSRQSYHVVGSRQPFSCWNLWGGSNPRKPQELDVIIIKTTVNSLCDSLDIISVFICFHCLETFTS